MAIIIRQLNELATEAVVTRTLVSGDNSIEGTPLETILGLEGAGSALYFSCFGKMLADQSDRQCFAGCWF